MARGTRIEWCTASWNPWYGCDRVSPGCAHCYAAAWAKRTGRSFAVQRAAASTFVAPQRWSQPEIVFTCSLGDFFHEDADEWRGDAWGVIRTTPQHTYLILTKRTELIADRLPSDWPLPNAWLGASVESQKQMHRLLDILKIPAAGRFLSMEPLLGPVDLGLLGTLPKKLTGGSYELVCDRLHWVVVGGESGPEWRPMKPEWVWSVRGQCEVAEIPFFFKQWGGHPDKRGGDAALLDGELVRESPLTPERETP